MPRDKYQFDRPEVVAMYDRLLAEQGGKCAIRGCAKTPKTRRFHIDHDHATGAVRGLLCHWHNRIMPKDSGEALALAAYLGRHENEQLRPKTRPCPNCNGSGKVSHSMSRHPQVCGRCDGRGAIPTGEPW